MSKLSDDLSFALPENSLRVAHRYVQYDIDLPSESEGRA